jgi:hypothetical protein
MLIIKNSRFTKPYFSNGFLKKATNSLASYRCHTSFFPSRLSVAGLLLWATLIAALSKLTYISGGGSGVGSIPLWSDGNPALVSLTLIFSLILFFHLRSLPKAPHKIFIIMKFSLLLLRHYNWHAWAYKPDV